MVVMVAYSAWVYPFEVAFMNASPKGGLEVVDLFFAVDIVLTFFVAYIDPRTQLLVRDRKKITFRYVNPAHTHRMPFALLHLSALQLQRWLGCMHDSGKEKFTNHL